MTMQKVKKILLRTCLVLIIMGLLGLGTVFAVNGYVVSSTKNRILTPQQATALTDVDCILVLG